MLVRQNRIWHNLSGLQGTDESLLHQIRSRTASMSAHTIAVASSGQLVVQAGGFTVGGLLRDVLQNLPSDTCEKVCFSL